MNLRLLAAQSALELLGESKSDVPTYKSGVILSLGKVFAEVHCFYEKRLLTVGNKNYIICLCNA